MNPLHSLAHALDPVAFAEDRLSFEPDPWQRRTMSSTSQRLILNCARQTGKSTVVAGVALHVALYDPGLILLVSPSLRQSRELFDKVTGFLKDLTPAEVLDEDNRLSCALANGARIVSLPGDPKTVRGFSAPKLVIEDEAAWVSDELHAALRPMLAVGRGRFMMLSTPNGRRGHFFDAWQNGGDAWERITVRAADCPRITAEFLAAERAELGDWRFRQEYECLFTETTDQLFGFDLVMGAFSAEVAPLFDAATLTRVAEAAR